VWSTRLGGTKIERTVRCLGIEVNDALAIANRWMSDLPGQSGHALPIRHQPLRAHKRSRYQYFFALDARRLNWPPLLDSVSAKPQELLGFASRAGYLLANLCQSMTDSRIAERFHDRPV